MEEAQAPTPQGPHPTVPDPYAGDPSLSVPPPPKEISLIQALADVLNVVRLVEESNALVLESNARVMNAMDHFMKSSTGFLRGYRAFYDNSMKINAMLQDMIVKQAGGQGITPQAGQEGKGEVEDAEVTTPDRPGAPVPPRATTATPAEDEDW